MHFQSSSLVLPSKTRNWFNFQLVVKVKPGDSIYFASSSYFRSAECGVFKGTPRGARASSKSVECKLEQPQQKIVKGDKPAPQLVRWSKTTYEGIAICPSNQVCKADWTLEKEVGKKEQEMGILTSYGWWGCRSAGTWWWWRGRETQRCRCPSPLLLYFVVLLDPPPDASSLPRDEVREQWRRKGRGERITAGRRRVALTNSQRKKAARLWQSILVSCSWCGGIERLAEEEQRKVTRRRNSWVTREQGLLQCQLVCAWLHWSYLILCGRAHVATILIARTLQNYIAHTLIQISRLMSNPKKNNLLVFRGCDAQMNHT